MTLDSVTSVFPHQKLTKYNEKASITAKVLGGISVHEMAKKLKDALALLSFSMC